MIATMALSGKATVLNFLLLFFVNVAHLQEEDEAVAAKHLTKNEYELMVESGARFLVNFVSPGCVKCTEFEPEYRQVASYFATKQKDMGIKVFIEGDLQVIRRQGLRRLPSVYYVRYGTPILYTGDMTARAIIDWVEVTGKKIHQTLTDQDFEHLTQAATGATTGDWLVLFCELQDSECAILLPMWESIAYRLHSVINVATVDLVTNPGLVKRFKLPQQPTIQLFKGGKRFTYQLQLRDDKLILAFARTAYKQFAGVDVEGEASPFDTLTENIADQLKDVLPEAHSSKLLVIGVPLLIIIAILVFISKYCTGGKKERTKKGV